MSVTFSVPHYSVPERELNIANTNFSSVFGLIGLDWCGSMDPVELGTLLNCIVPDQHTRECTQEGNFIDCGLPAERVEFYLSKLRELIVLAIQTKSQVVWG